MKRNLLNGKQNTEKLILTALQRNEDGGLEKKQKLPTPRALDDAERKSEILTPQNSHWHHIFDGKTITESVSSEKTLEPPSLISLKSQVLCGTLFLPPNVNLMSRNISRTSSNITKKKKLMKLVTKVKELEQ